MTHISYNMILCSIRLVSKCSTDYHAVTSNFFISSVTVWCGILLQYSVVSDLTYNIISSYHLLSR